MPALIQFNHATLIRLQISKRGNNFAAKKTDRAHEIFFGHSTEIELAQNSIEHALFGGALDLLDDRCRRADEG